MATRRIGNISIDYTPTANQTNMYNALGRNTGEVYGNQVADNGSNGFFADVFQGLIDNVGNKIRAGENTIGTTASMIPAWMNVSIEEGNQKDRLNKWDKSMQDIYKNAGFNSADDYYNAKDAAEKAVYSKYGFDIDDYWNRRAEADAKGDTGLVTQIDNELNTVRNQLSQEDRNALSQFDTTQSNLINQANANMGEAKTAADNWRDYLNNSYIGKKTMQDNGKFAGDAITTLSTATDLAAMGTGLPMGIAANAIQGGLEGLASELSQNGGTIDLTRPFSHGFEAKNWDNFDLGRAAQNAAVGAVSGAATAGLSKALNARAATKAAAKGVTKAPGLLKTVGLGAGRGALSGAVGGAVGGGLGAGIESVRNGEDLGIGAQNALLGALGGATKGAVSGSVSGAAMSGLNYGVGKAVTKIDDKYGTNLSGIGDAGKRWKESGSNFNERLTNTLNSGESGVGNWINNRTQSKLLNRLGGIGNRVQDVTPNYKNARKLAERLYEAYDEADPYENANSMANMAEDWGIDTSKKGWELKAKNRWIRETANDMLGKNPIMPSTEWAKNINGYLDPEEYPMGDFGGGEVNPITGGSLSRDKIVALQNDLRAFAGEDVSDQPTDWQGWLKKAGSRALDDLNNKGVGLSTKIVDGEEADVNKPYGQALNNAMDQGLTGSELGDAIADYSNLPKNITGEQLWQLAQKNPDLMRSVEYVANEAYDSGDRNVNYDTIAENYWNEVRADYAQAQNYEGPGNYYDSATQPSTDDQLARLGKKYTGASFTEQDLQSKTPAQDAYADGRGDFSDAWREFISQGGDVVKDANGNWQLVAPDTLTAQANNIFSKYDALTGEIPTNAPAYGNYKSQRASVINDLRNNFSDNDLAFLYTKTDDPKIRAITADAVRSLEVLNRLADYENQGPTYDQELVNALNRANTTTVQPAATANPTYPDDINNMVINRNDMFDTTAESPETELYRQLVGENGTSNPQAVQQPQQQAVQTTKAAQPTTNAVSTNANTQWDNLAREYGYQDYNQAIQAYAQANPGKNVSAGAVLTWLDNNEGTYNPNATTTMATTEEVPKALTGRQIRAKRDIVKDITSQFETVDKPTQRATKPMETFYNLYDEWGLSDGDDIRQAVAYADRGSLIPNMIREAAGESGIIDVSDAEGMIRELGINQKNYSKYVNALEDLMESTETTIIGGKKGVDALTLQRSLEQAASDAEGTDGTYHIGNTLVDSTMAKNFRRIANEIGTKLDEASVAKNAVANTINRHAADLQAMKNAFPNNETWQEAVETKVIGAKTIGDLRHSIRDLVRANIFIDNGDNNTTTFGGRVSGGLTSGGRGSNKIPTTTGSLRNRAINAAYDAAMDSKVARDVRLKRNAQIVSGDNAGATGTQAAATTPETALYNMLNKKNFNNVLGRNIGEVVGSDNTAPVSDYIEQASTEEGYVAPLGATTSSTGSTAGTTATTVANAISGNGSTGSNSGITGQFSSTGNEQVDLLGRAMELAMAAEDAPAFATLYSMYNSALSSAQDSGTTELNTTQQNQVAKLQNASDALDELVDLYNGATGAKGPITGNLQGLAGNLGWDPGAQSYNDSRGTVASEIAQALYGTKSEANVRRIEQQLPQLTDSSQAAAKKINTLREMLLKAQNNYYNAYGLSS